MDQLSSPVEPRIRRALSEFVDADLERTYLSSRLSSDVHFAMLLACCVGAHYFLISLLDLVNLAYGLTDRLGEIAWYPFWIRNGCLAIAALFVAALLRIKKHTTFRNCLLTIGAFSMGMVVYSQWNRPPEYVGATSVIILVFYFAPLPMRYVLAIVLPFSAALLHLTLAYKVPTVPHDTTAGIASIIGLNLLGYFFSLRVRRLVREQYAKDNALQRSRAEAKRALAEVRVLSGLLPICASCKMIRDENDTWHHMESYISHRSEARFTHGMCPDCSERFLNERD